MSGRLLAFWLKPGGSPRAASLGLAILRIIAGFSLFWAHGLPKLVNFAEKSQRFGDPLGLGRPVSLALAVFAEFFCAALVTLGIAPRLASLPILITLAVAAFGAHAGTIFGKGELAWIYGLVFLAIFITGGGSFSVVSLFRRR